MKDYKIRRVKSYNSILKNLQECSDCLFNQKYNNKECLKELSKKYSKNALFYILEIENETAGIISFYANDTIRKVGFVTMIVVKKQYQGLKLGNILIDIAISVCKLQGLFSLQLEVNGKNEKAVRFYERNGFSIHENKDGNLVLSKSVISS